MRFLVPVKDHFDPEMLPSVGGDLLPKLSRLREVLGAALLLAAAVLGAAPASAQHVVAPNATPLPDPPGNAPMGFYIMAAGRIVSKAYSDAAACQKALALIQRTTAPGNDMLVCAHRRP